MKEKTLKNPLILLCFLALTAALALCLLPRSAADEAEPSSPADAVNEVRLSDRSELIQTLTYTRCEHSLKRRLTAPVELYGLPLADAEALYPSWRITEYGSGQIKMEQRLQMFCPDHMVLMPDGAGMLCVFENKYGDALALVSELNIPVKSLPAAAQEEVQMGLGFSTPEEMEMWLESVES